MMCSHINIANCQPNQLSHSYFDTPPYLPPNICKNKQHIKLKFMEMPVCNDEAAHKLGICLTKFFRELDGGSGVEDVVKEKEETKPVVKEAANKSKKSPSPTSVVASSPPPPARVVSPRSSSSSNNSSSSWMASKQSSASNNVYDARSSSQRRQDEMKNMFGSSSAGGGGGGSSIKERMKAFNNESSVNFDPVHFAVRKNKEAKGKCVVVCRGLGRIWELKDVCA